MSREKSRKGTHYQNNLSDTPGHIIDNFPIFFLDKLHIGAIIASFGAYTGSAGLMPRTVRKGTCTESPAKGMKRYVFPDKKWNNGNTNRIMASASKRKCSKRLPAQPNQSLARGIECFQVLATSDKPVGSREMARILGFEHTGVNRILGTLAWLGLAEQTPDRKYAPGSAIHVLAALSLRSSRLLSSALPHLKSLCRETEDCSIALGVLWKSYVCYLFFRTPGNPVENCIASRDPFPAENSSIGRVLLAHKSDKDVKALYRKRHNNRLSSKELTKLIAGLDQVRSDRYALVNGQTLGVAVSDPPSAGLALAGDFNKKHVPKLVSILQKYAERIALDA